MVRRAACMYVLCAALPLMKLSALGTEGGPPASAELDPEAVLRHERDVLIGRIACGEELEASVSAFQKLLQRRTQLLIAIKEAAERARKEEEARRAAEQEAIEKQRRAEAEQKEREKQEKEAEKLRQAARHSYLNSL